MSSATSDPDLKNPSIENCARQNKRYEPATWVPGKCVKNKSDDSGDRERGSCSEGKYWRPSYLRPARCVEPFKRKLKQELKEELQKKPSDDEAKALPECDHELTDPFFYEELEAIRLYVREYLTIPDAPLKWNFTKLVKKLKDDVVVQLKSKMKDENCRVVLSPEQAQQLETLAREEFKPQEEDLTLELAKITPEQWEKIKKFATLDVIFLACRTLRNTKKNKFDSNDYVHENNWTYTKKYEKYLNSLRKFLVNFQANNLLPSQNLVVYDAYHRYVSQFTTLPDAPQYVTISKEQQHNNLEVMKIIALQEGFLESRNPNNILFKRENEYTHEIPEFMKPRVTVENGTPKLTYHSQTYFPPRRILQPYLKPKFLQPKPDVLPNTVIPETLGPIAKPTKFINKPLEPGLNWKSDEFLKLFFVFHLHDDIINLRPAFTQLGKQKYSEFELLMAETMKNDKKHYIDNLDRLRGKTRLFELSEIEREYGGPLFDMSKVMFTCQNCGQILCVLVSSDLLTKYQCGNCHALHRVNFPEHTVVLLKYVLENVDVAIVPPMPPLPSDVGSFDRSNLEKFVELYFFFNLALLNENLLTHFALSDITTTNLLNVSLNDDDFISEHPIHLNLTMTDTGKNLYREYLILDKQYKDKAVLKEIQRCKRRLERQFSRPGILGVLPIFFRTHRLYNQNQPIFEAFKLQVECPQCNNFIVFTVAESVRFSCPVCFFKFKLEISFKILKLLKRIANFGPTEVTMKYLYELQFLFDTFFELNENKTNFLLTENGKKMYEKYVNCLKILKKDMVTNDASEIRDVITEFGVKRKMPLSLNRLIIYYGGPLWDDYFVVMAKEKQDLSWKEYNEFVELVELSIIFNNYQKLGQQYQLTTLGQELHERYLVLWNNWVNWVADVRLECTPLQALKNATAQTDLIKPITDLLEKYNEPLWTRVDVEENSITPLPVAPTLSARPLRLKRRSSAVDETAETLRVKKPRSSREIGEEKELIDNQEMVVSPFVREHIYEFEELFKLNRLFNEFQEINKTNNYTLILTEAGVNAHKRYFELYQQLQQQAGQKRKEDLIFQGLLYVQSTLPKFSIASFIIQNEPFWTVDPFSTSRTSARKKFQLHPYE
jgi:predicted RNA-binding Zn-ribbon protein involved in translation (DUF1610 family)